MDTASECAKIITQTVHEPLVILDTSLHIISASSAFRSLFRLSGDEINDLLIYELNNGELDIPELRTLLDSAIHYNENTTNLELQHQSDRVGEKVLVCNASRIVLGQPGETLILLAIEDVTGRTGSHSGSPGTGQSDEELRRLEKQLGDERDFVTAVIQTSGALITVIDPYGNITRFNKASEELTGYAAHEVIGRSLFDLFIPAEEREAVSAIAARLFGGEKRVDFENHWVTRYGEKRFIRWRNSMLLNEVGEPVYAIATGIDITDRKKSEEALLQSEASLKRAQEIAHLGSWELDRITDRLTWSDEIYRIFGLQPQEFGASYEAFLDHVHPDDREAVDSAYIQSVQDGSDSYEIEHRVIRKYTGETRYVHEKCQHVRGPDGHVIRSIGMAHDITERKRAQEELLESRERFAAAFRSVQDALILSDLETSLIIDVNQTWISHWGYKAEESIGHRSVEMEIFSDLADRERLSQIIRKEGRVENFETLLRKKSGEIRHVILHAERLMLPNQSLMLTTIHDITERKVAENEVRQRTEELAAANRDLEAFSYSVSHDLRSPLATIHGYINLILENHGTGLDENGKGLLNQITTAANKMAIIIDDLLKMAKISRKTMTCQETDLSRIANSIIDELRRMEPGRNVHINIADTMPVFADPGFMTITLTNLIGNAWKYTGRNQETIIDIGVINIEKENVYFIRDNGAGFDMKFAHKLFKPFERLHPDSEFTGTGIGLTIVDKIIQRHGGRIWAESEPGKGAVIYFTLNCLSSAMLPFASLRKGPASH